MRHVVVMVTTSYPRFPGDSVGTFMEPIAHVASPRVATKFMSSRRGTRWSRGRPRSAASTCTSIATRPSRR